MGVDERLRAGLTAAVSGSGGALAVAHDPCAACVTLLEVDGAGLCLALDTATRGSLGASGELRRRLDGLQVTGPRPSAEVHAVSRTEGDVTRAFVAFPGGLAGGADVLDLLDQLTGASARLLDVASAGLLLADGRGVAHVLAASSERTRELELFQLQRAEGRAWTATAAARRSACRTWTGPRTGGRSSSRTPARPASPASTPCRCGCAGSGSAPL